MRNRALRMAVAVAVLGVVPLLRADPAAAAVAVTGAAGGLELQYVMEGTLPVFPCLGCTATFGGGAKGAGWMHADAFDQLWDVKIESLNMSAGNSGRVVYQESGTPYCPALGQAAGTITMTDPYVTGTVFRSGRPNEVGELDAVTVTVSFTYQRVGAAVAIAVTSASIRADFHTPTLAGSLTASSAGMAGAATGVFVVSDPALVVSRCNNPGPLAFLLAGTASVEIVHAPRTGGEYKDEGDLYAIGTGGQDEGGRFLCASAGGWTYDCFVAATTTGASTGNVVGVTGTGASIDNIAAVTGTGSSSANYLGVTGTGTSTGNDVSVSGTNRADGDCNSVCWEGGGNTASISGTGPAAAGSCASMVAVSITGDACGRSAAVSGTGNADGGMQVSGKEAACARTGLMC